MAHQTGHPVEDWRRVRERTAQWDADHAARHPGWFIEEVNALMAMHHPQALPPQDIAALLAAAGIRYVLIGAHAVAVYTRTPRATHDADFIVDDSAAAVRAVLAGMPGLTVANVGHAVGTTLLSADGTPVIDLLLPTHLGRDQALADARPVRVAGVRVQVPSLETMVALKFIAVHSINPDGSPGRPPMKRMYDSGDILGMIAAHPEFDSRRVADFLARACNADFAARWERELPDALVGKGFPPD